MTSNELAVAVNPDEQGALEVRRQVNQIQHLLKNVLIEGEHYGTIPGVSKPSLMQSGAEKICAMFKLVPHYEVKREDVTAISADGKPVYGHREYTVTCTLTDQNGVTRGEAVASCSTMESRYRYRKSQDWEDTGQPIPKDAKERKAEYRRQGYGMKKVDGQWLWVRFIGEERQENPDIADVWNTVLQIAEKRAFVRATRSTTAASDIFTQDVEDLPQYMMQAVPQAPQPNDDMATLKGYVSHLASIGYNEGEVKSYLWGQYKHGGIQAARRAYDDMARAVSNPDVAQEADEYEDVEP